MKEKIQHILGLIDRYWDLAYAEGKESRNHDTKNGDATSTRLMIESELIKLITPPKKEDPKKVGYAIHMGEHGIDVEDDWRHLLQYGYAPGRYTGQCHACGIMCYDIDKRASVCKSCAQDRFDKDHKNDR